MTLLLIEILLFASISIAVYMLFSTIRKMAH